MKIILLICVGLLLWSAAFAQKNELGVIVAGLGINKYRTDFDTSDTLNVYSSVKATVVGFEGIYTRTFQNNNYISIGYGIDITDYSSPRTNDLNFGIQENNDVYRQFSHTGLFEYGKEINFSTIQFQYGLSGRYTRIPNFIRTYTQEEFQNDTLMSTTVGTQNHPASDAVGIYLSTAAYVHVFKRIAIGLQMKNGFIYSHVNGSFKYHVDRFDANKNLIESSDRNDDAKQNYLRSDFLNIGIGIKYQFGK